jgi:hypothetical protein
MIDLSGNMPDAAELRGIRKYVQKLQHEMKLRRRVLNADELLSLKDVQVNLEKDCGKGFWLFSINGTLNGTRITGALFAGECIMVYAKSQAEAVDRAAAGLQTTMELALEYFEQQERQIREQVLEPGYAIDPAAGRRAHRPLSDRSIPQQRKLAAMVQSVLSGKPFER